MPAPMHPQLYQLPDGDLLCAWFAGSYEGNSDNLWKTKMKPFYGKEFLDRGKALLLGGL